MTTTPRTDTAISALSLSRVQLIELLRACPYSDKADTAPAELLIAFSDGNLLDNPKLRHFIDIHDGAQDVGTYATIRWYDLSLQVNDSSMPARLYINSAERWVISVACSLAIGELSAAGLLDQANRVLVVRAVATVLGVGGTATIVRRMYQAEHRLTGLEAQIQKLRGMCRTDAHPGGAAAYVRLANGDDEPYDATGKHVLNPMLALPVSDVLNVIGEPATTDEPATLAASRTFQPASPGDNPVDQVRQTSRLVLALVRAAGATGMTEAAVIGGLVEQHSAMPHPVVVQAALLCAITDGLLIGEPGDDRYYAPEFAPDKEQA